MNFFQQQRQAKRRTLLLIVLMALAVLSLIAVSCVLMTIPVEDGDGNVLFDLEMSWELIGYVSAVVISVVLLGSTAKHSELSAGAKSLPVASTAG